LLAGPGAQLRSHNVQSDNEGEKDEDQGDAGCENPFSHRASGRRRDCITNTQQAGIATLTHTRALDHR
jgi:hypothetical protein